ncbi:MAG TPA: XrtA/PEP-CTERM system-associated ATPase [Burkholderiaceae bacterium]|nr:XrtA/PEP-CTERM system-associated ATPase [Burkholderiaceae bacterium]
MYESKFGFTSPPFQLNPDPAFYFDSRGHSNALSYLKFGVHQGEGFIVVTGEIGAGKTTLVRTLLEGVNSEEVAAAQVLNTQLESGELLQAILTAFGVASSGGSKAQLLASLEAFLTAVAAEGRRALLIVDEAQNLGREAIEELRMLSNFQLGNHALLQSFLIGQPELRKQLESPAMEQLRQRVIASCHLGPLVAEETRAYIEHRLRHVGWSDQPSFEDGAFEAIHQCTGGIPRRINLLCNRLLLAAFLSDETRITAALVRTTASDLARETGGPRVLAEVAPVREPEVAPGSAAVAVAPRAAAPAAAEHEVVRVVKAGVDAAALKSPLLLLADSALGAFKAAVLSKVLAATEGVPACVLVAPGEPGDADPGALAPGLSESLAMQVHLRAGTGGMAQRLAALSTRLDALFDELQPSALVTFGISVDVLVCSLLANKRGLPLAHLGAGQRRELQSRNGDTNAVVIDRLSDVLYTPTLKAHYTLYKEGISADRMVCVGNPLADGLRPVTSLMAPVSELLKGAGLSRDQLRRALRGYALVSAQSDGVELAAAELPKIARVARDLGRETLVVWIVSEATAADIRASKADALLSRSGVVLVPGADYAMRLGLLRGATCTIAGPDWELVEEADLLDIPSIVLHPNGDVPPGAPGGVIARIGCDSAACVRALHEILERGRADDEVAEVHDGSPTQRVADHLRGWLFNPTKRQRSGQQLSGAAAA